jgi:S-adenosylmethionine uptake transporter
MVAWFKEVGKRQGIFWGILLNFIGSANDAISRMLGDRLHFIEISFFRFFFSMVIIAVPIAFSNQRLLKSKIHTEHAIRGALGTVALCLCCCSVNIMPLAENTTILFSDTFFTLILAAMFLNEKPRIQSWIAVAIGLIGVVVMYKPNGDNINIAAIIPTAASIIFAIMNIMIKRMVNIREHMITALFYFGLYTTVISGLFVPFYWVQPTLREILLLFALGAGAILIQVCIFLAFRATDASNISPLRYTELLFSIIFGFMFFDQVPGNETIAGAVLIIAGSIVLSLDSRDKNMSI